MSHYTEVRTQIRDAACLVKALVKMGFKPHQIEQLSEKEQLLGYQGDKRKQRADIRIKGSGWKGNNHVGGASNDLGWERQADGTYAFHVSENEKHRYGKPWQDNLEANYTAEVVEVKARQMGYQMVQNTTDESGEITIKVRAF